MEALELGVAEDIVGDEDVGAAGIGEHLGLGDLLAGEADGAERQLALREGRDLVGLDMGAGGKAGPRDERLAAHEIALDPLEIDEHRRRIDRLQHAPRDLSHDPSSQDLWIMRSYYR